MASRVALFGGTFDPIHNAHIEIARSAADRFDLDRVLFVPAANPPHKPTGASAPYADRVHMVEIACRGDDRFEVSTIEDPSLNNNERSYSVLTIEKLREQGVTRPYFLIGADAFREIRSWYRWRDVLASVEFIVVTRPGATWETPDGAVVHELSDMYLPISSSAIRDQICRGQVAVTVPPAVLDYIRGKGLYGSCNSG